jgi:hypothetical protein
VRALVRGYSKQAACGAAGISTSTLNSWMEEDPELSEIVEIAMLKGENHLLRNIAKAGEEPRNWVANAWILERTRQERYAIRARVQADIGTIVIPHTLAEEIRSRLDQRDAPPPPRVEEPVPVVSSRPVEPDFVEGEEVP